MAQAKRILFLAPNLEAGGSERVFTTLLRHADRSRFHPELALLEKRGPLLGDVPPDVPVHEIGVSRARYALPGIIKLIRRSRPDVVMATLGHLNLALMLCRPLLPPGTRLVARESNIVSRILERGPAYLPHLYRWLYPRFDAVVCQSRDMLEDLTACCGLPHGKGMVIHNPVDVEQVRERAGEPSGLPEGVVNLVAAGSLTRQKGFDMLLDAFAGLERGKYTLTILGEGGERMSLEAQAAGLGVVSEVDFRGRVSNPWAVMAAADAFVLSSRYEGFPNVVLEALACGTPVIAFSCPGGLDEIIVPGENGVLVEVGDVAGLTGAMADPPRLDAEALRLDVVTRFGAREIAARYASLWETVAGGVA